MSQNSFSEGNESGAAYRAGINAALQALASNNSGGSAPATPYAQQIWVDTDTPSSTIWTINMYDGTDWISMGYIDSTNNVLLPFIGGGTATVASNSTVDLGASPQSTITISGVTTVTSFGTSMKPGQSKVVIASGAWQLTYNSTSMKINGSASYTMVAGDKALVTCGSAGNYDVTIFPKSGQSVASGAVKVVSYPVVADTTDITLSVTPTQANVGSTLAVVIPAKGFVQLRFAGQVISSGGAAGLVLGIRIGATNYWPKNVGDVGGAFTDYLTAYQGVSAGTYHPNGWGGDGAAAANGTGGSQEVGISIEDAGIPTGSQTVQIIAACNGFSMTMKGTAVTSRVYLTTSDHS